MIRRRSPPASRPGLRTTRSSTPRMTRAMKRFTRRITRGHGYEPARAPARLLSVVPAVGTGVGSGRHRDRDGRAAAAGSGGGRRCRRRGRGCGRGRRERRVDDPVVGVGPGRVLGVPVGGLRPCPWCGRRAGRTRCRARCGTRGRRRPAPSAVRSRGRWCACRRSGAGTVPGVAGEDLAGARPVRRSGGCANAIGVWFGADFCAICSACSCAGLLRLGLSLSLQRRRWPTARLPAIRWSASTAAAGSRRAARRPGVAARRVAGCA